MSAFEPDVLAAAAAFTAAVATQTSFVWAIRRFFRAPEGLRPGMRAIATLGGLSTLLQLAALGYAVSSPPGALASLVGAALLLLAFGLFWSAVWANLARPLTLAFSEDAPAHLVTWGPYRRVRHPFYAAYLLAWLGGAAGAAEPLLLVSAVVMGGLYVDAARREERKFAAGPLAGAYAAYRRQAGLFWPVLRSGAKASPAAPLSGSSASRPA